MYIRYAWCHTSGKSIQEGTVYEFVENLTATSKANIFNAKILSIEDLGEKIKLELRDIKTNEEFNKYFPKIEENHVGIIQIYNYTSKE